MVASPLPDGNEIVLEATSRLDAVRGLVGTGRLADAVRAAGVLAGVSAEPHALVASPVSALPPALASPVGRLAAAVEAAGDLIRSALRTDRETAARIGRDLRHAERRLSREGVAPGWERLPRLGEAAVDRGAVYASALTLATALDRALPELAAAVRWQPVPLPGGDEAACDVLDQPPYLCVGGTGQNVYANDYALLVDLGGDDLHAHAAGAADSGAVNVGGNGLFASLTLDLDGNDRYESAVPSPSGARAVQGSGLSAVGALVDVAGNDSYSAHAEKGDQYVQGQGLGAVGGAGILADLGGNDSYGMTNVTPGRFGAVAGLGYAGFLGIGLALDAAGNDTYLQEARRTAPAIDDYGNLTAGSATLQGFGVAGLAQAVFADGGGTDTVSQVATTFPIPPDESRSMSESYAGASGFGWGAIGGAAVALFGSGPTSRSVVMEHSAPVTGPAGAEVFGVGAAGGYGAIHDAGGNDTYLVRGTATAVRDASVDDACGCPGVEATARSGGTAVRMGGVGILAGVGVLQDVSGDDRYEAVATATAEARARDDRTDLPPPPPPPPEGEPAPVVGAVARATAMGGYVVGQAWGALESVGVLEDSAGNDVYESRVTIDARASASARHPEAPTEARAVSGRALTEAQARGTDDAHVVLRDLGGSDAYRSVNTSMVLADPPTEESSLGALSHVQGSVALATAVFADLDSVGTDVFVSVPENPACVGTRGAGAWVDCGLGAGVGVNA